MGILQELLKDIPVPKWQKSKFTLITKGSMTLAQP